MESDIPISIHTSDLEESKEPLPKRHQSVDLDPEANLVSHLAPKKFRLNTSAFFLTYPQCPLDPYDVLHSLI
jgi:hypothetical protein